MTSTFETNAETNRGRQAVSVSNVYDLVPLDLVDILLQLLELGLHSRLTQLLSARICHDREPLVLLF